ncbi:MAG: ComF family protein [Clostridia bacterium]|nr:ComF family protein [Clostridia bacterium]
MNFSNILLNLISPPVCLACNKYLPTYTNALFCPKCGKNYPIIKGKTCNICGKPISNNSDDTCIECKENKRYFIKNVSRYTYKGCIKTAIKNMKFKNYDWIAFEFGRQICKTIEEKYSDINFDLVMYVPMTKLSEMNRTFNQTFELAYAVSRKFKIPIENNVIYKMPNVKTQSGLSKKDRLENVKNGYIILKPEKIIDKTILLIDDVITTGATLNECSKTLKKAGALAVYTATVAITTFDE